MIKTLIYIEEIASNLSEDDLRKALSFYQDTIYDSEPITGTIFGGEKIDGEFAL